MSISTGLLRGLADFDTPTICNVIELFEVRPRDTGYMNGRIKSAFPEMRPMVGYAVTTCFSAKAAPESHEGYGSFEDQLEIFEGLPGPAVMLYQDLDEPAVAATFGEVMCSSYQSFGAAGLITSGAGRDLEQVRALGFPVFTSGTICSHGYGRWSRIGQPVQIGGISIETGALLHGDANGVTTIPLEIAADVADVAPEFIAAEDITIGYAKSPGAKSIAEFMERRAATEEAIAKLKQRIVRHQY